MMTRRIIQLLFFRCRTSIIDRAAGQCTLPRRLMERFRFWPGCERFMLDALYEAIDLT